MGYVVVVFAIINSAFLVVFAIGFWYLHQDILASVGTVIQDEVRKQDDRIEKRLEKRQGKPPNEEEALDGASAGVLRVGAPFRR